MAAYPAISVMAAAAKKGGFEMQRAEESRLA